MNDIGFVKRMRHAQEEELQSVVSSGGFVPAAVEAAKAELARRNINSDELAEIKDRVEARQRADELSPSIGLSTGGKVACFTFCIPAIPAALLLRMFGHRQKSKEALKWAALGIVFWSVVGFAWGFITAV